MKRTVIIGVCLVLTTGCSTTARFKVPEGAELYLANRPKPVTIADD